MEGAVKPSPLGAFPGDGETASRKSFRAPVPVLPGIGCEATFLCLGLLIYTKKKKSEDNSLSHRVILRIDV